MQRAGEQKCPLPTPLFPSDAVAQRAAEQSCLVRLEVKPGRAGIAQGVGLIACLDASIRSPRAEEYRHGQAHEHHYQELQRQSKNPHVIQAVSQTVILHISRQMINGGRDSSLPLLSHYLKIVI